MCNLYNITTAHEAIIQWSRAMYDRAGNLEPSLDVYPNYKAPVVRAAADGEREIVRLNWGMPSPPDRVKGKADYGTTNILRPNFWHWRQWLGVEHRCIVPATSFAEPSPTPADKDSHGHPAQFLVRCRRDQAAVLLRRHMEALARRSPRQGWPTAP